MPQKNLAEITVCSATNIEDDNKYGCAYPSLTFVKNIALLTYFVYDENTSRIDLKLKTVPVGWLYRK